MTDEILARLQEYNRAISIDAKDRLRHSQNLQPLLIDSRGLRLGQPKLRLWRDGADFNDYDPQTLTVFEPFDDQAPLLRKAVWKFSVDTEATRECYEGRLLETLPKPIPTFEVQDRRIDRSRFEALLEEACEWRLPVVWPWHMEQDAVTSGSRTVGFQFYSKPQPQASVQCSWSVDLPPEWEPVVDWFGRMLDWLDGHFVEP